MLLLYNTLSIYFSLEKINIQGTIAQVELYLPSIAVS